MNPDEKTKGPWKPVWPGLRGTLLRLLLIAIVLFPLFWMINALLVGSWNLLEDRTAESVRHLVEWQITWIMAAGVVFLASLLPRFHWFFNRRNARRWISGLACLVTLAALFYAEENWRGARAWEKYRRQLEAPGVQVDFASFRPQPVPDEQNFAATPLLKSWLVRTNGNFPDWVDDFSRADTLVFSRGPEKNGRSFVDLAAYEAAFAAIRSGKTNSPAQPDGRNGIPPQTGTKQPADVAQPQPGESAKFDPDSRAKAAPGVLAGLSDDESIFAELRAASGRPHSTYAVVYDLENPWGILLPHLGKLKGVCRRLQIKACAELAAGQSENALEDVKLLLRMTDSVKEEPFLISYLVRVACVQIATQPVWEGLAEHRWSDAQLQELQSRFEQYDFLTEMERPLAGERAAGILTAEVIRKKGLGLLIELIGPESPASVDKKFANWVGGFIPRGWYHLEQVNYCRLFQMQLEGAYNTATRRVSPERIEANTHELERQISAGRLGKSIGGFLHHRYIAALLLPTLNKIPPKAAAGQIAADHAALACALERFRLANGNFPDTLDALAPKFISHLPHDTFTGEAYKYRRTDDGQFILYSVGWNEKDDGGTPDTLGAVIKNLFGEKGDWVWRYPAK